MTDAEIARYYQFTYGYFIGSIIAEDVLNASWLLSEGRIKEASHWIMQAIRRIANYEAYSY